MSTGHRSSFKVVVDGGELSRELSRGLSRRNVGRRDKGLRDASSSCSVSPEAPLLTSGCYLLLIVFWTDCRLRSGLLITVARMIITVCNPGGKQTAPPPRSSSGPSNYTITGHWSVVTPAPATLGTNILHSIVIMTSPIDSSLQAVKTLY